MLLGREFSDIFEREKILTENVKNSAIWRCLIYTALSALLSERVNLTYSAGKRSNFLLE